MNVEDKQQRFWVLLWLGSGLFLVLVMLIVGGITRLTGSGLSIVEWKLISGILPPLSEEEWNASFDAYKRFPQYLEFNGTMSLSGFKEIFWWEYIHRFIGRLIGVVFIVPFCYFILRGKISASLMQKLIFLFMLGLSQGLLGWFMVKSGLVDNPNVSHFRLAAHLGLAFILAGYIFWIMLDLLNPSIRSKPNALKAFSFVILFFIYFQIILGGLVAGLKAGLSFNTFPLMDDKIVPLSSMGKGNLLYSGVFIQFIHRWFAFVILIAASIFYSKTKSIPPLKSKGRIFLALLVCQVALGISTLVLQVPLILAVLHQLAAFLLFLSILNIVYVLNCYPAEVNCNEK